VPLTELYRRSKDANAVLVKDFDHSVAGLPAHDCGAGCHLYLDIQNTRRRSYRQIEAELADALPVVAYRVLRYASPPPDDTPQFTVRYWLLYLYNRLAGDNHEGDLEQVTIRTDTTPTPKEAFYSAHVAGTVRQWSDLESRGTHPVVYVAVGSHANYFATGVEGTVARCPRRHNERDVKCNAVGNIAADHANGCGDVWALQCLALTDWPGASTSCANGGGREDGQADQGAPRWRHRRGTAGHHP
jgi:hypothetical protein